MRRDAHRFLPPAPPRWATKDEVRLFWGDCAANRARRDADQADGRVEIDELLRLKRELQEIKSQLRLRRALRDIKAYNPNQPRVPAGNPDGGQWTTEGAQGTPTRIAQRRPALTEISASRRVRSKGHHWVPRQVFESKPFPKETKKVFEDATSGPLGFRATSEEGLLRGHFWDGPNGAHKAYNDAVEQHLKRFMAQNNIRAEQMTPSHAREFLREIHASQDPRIRDYNNVIRFLRYLRLLRIGRGTE
jgi:hypothetical protein